MKTQFMVPEDRPFFGKFWPQGVPHQLEYNWNQTLRDVLLESSQKWPEAPLIWFLDGWINYRQFQNFVDKFATSLSRMGISKGDTVALHLPNCPQYAVAYYAVVSLGAVVTGINPTYKPLEILHQLKITKAKSIVVLDALYTNFVQPLQDKWEFDNIIYTNLLDLAQSFSKFKKWLAITMKKVPKTQVNHPRAVSFLNCLNKGIEIDIPKVKINPAEDPAVLMMTGGTTGVPKAAILTHQNVVSNTYQCVLTLKYQKNPERTRLLGEGTGNIGILPLFHSFAMTAVMNSSILLGAWMVLFPKPPPTEELLKTLEKLPNINGFFYVGAEILFQRIAELDDKVLRRYNIEDKLQLCISGAGPLHDYVRIPFERKTGAKIREGYGLAEASPVVSCNNFFGVSDPGTVSTPFPGTDWAIFPIDEFEKGPITVVGEEGTGELCVCGPQVMKGYLNEPERTNDVIKEWDNRKWLRTGDIGYMDEHGRIVIRDRKKQLIKMAGRSIFPKEVEILLGNHPAVLEVAVAGIPDKKTGEAVKAWVSLKPEMAGTLTTEDLLKWAKNNITYWKVPKYLEIIDEIPKNAIGKVMRRQLQESDPMFQKTD